MYINIVKFSLEPGTSLENLIKVYEREFESQRNLPGLLNAHFLHGDHAGGVIYIWYSRSDAELFFTTERVNNLEKLFGAKPKIDWFENPTTLDNSRDLSHSLIRGFGP